VGNDNDATTSSLQKDPLAPSMQVLCDSSKDDVSTNSSLPETATKEAFKNNLTQPPPPLLVICSSTFKLLRLAKNNLKNK
jgi:hypothetical protein